jgi:hypothetical protein
MARFDVADNKAVKTFFLIIILISLNRVVEIGVTEEIPLEISRYDTFLDPENVKVNQSQPSRLK